MADSDSSDSEPIQRVESEKGAPKCFEVVPSDMEFKLKVKIAGAKSKRFVYKLTKGSVLPYISALKGRLYIFLKYDLIIVIYTRL